MIVLFANSLAYKLYFTELFNFCQVILQSFLKYFLSSSRKVDKTMFPTFEIVKELCNKQGISLNNLEERIGFARNSLYSWKNSEPKPKKLKVVADYFNVSTDYLLGRTDNPAIAGDSKEYIWQGKVLNVEEMASNVMMFGGRELTDEKKKIIQSIIEGYLKEAGD
ncbi:putative phage DNA binding protein [Streptococcus pneumoniae]|nr:phage transcriptional regulator, Cro/CI family [Streptococcus pneumoniae]CAG5147149.1 phage transcriptional regulator, Cro/CI family [Streptococcus pneumoniae]CAG5148140.1 phage transcriptional regulator, Cro/CI family [Streptococcus pneumoniae]CAG5738822.1 phage transcriptional regulator, Cro/CI family [Streptococcus pneumoniae]CAG7570297.1 phage transcriptional regulator, Cro/CI family [Streptococcus pneumoniae]